MNAQSNPWKKMVAAAAVIGAIVFTTGAPGADDLQISALAIPLTTSATLPALRLALIILENQK